MFMFVVFVLVLGSLLLKFGLSLSLLITNSLFLSHTYIMYICMCIRNIVIDLCFSFLSTFLADCNGRYGSFYAKAAVSSERENSRKVRFTFSRVPSYIFFCIQVSNVHSWSALCLYMQLLAGLKQKKETVKVEGGLQASATGSNGGSFQGWELRRVPSGPDPLHHNGGNPTKPRTPWSTTDEWWKLISSSRSRSEARLEWS